MKIIVRKGMSYLIKEDTDALSDYNTFVFQSLHAIDCYKKKDWHTRKFVQVKERKPLSESSSGKIQGRTMLSGLVPLLESTGIKVERDHSLQVLHYGIANSELRSILPQYELRQDQIFACTKCLLRKRGIVQLPTGSGKSSIISAILKYILKYNPDAKFLVVAPTTVTVNNMLDTLRASGVNCSSYANDPELESSVIVSGPAKLLNNSKKGLLDLSIFNGVIYDEAHHVSSASYQELSSKLINVELALGFSAKVISTDHVMSKNISDYSYSELLVIRSTGPVIMYIPPKEYISNNILATPVVYRVLNQVSSDVSNSSDWHELSSKVLMGFDRSNKATIIASQLVRHHRKVLILVAQKSHAYLIGDLLVGFGIHDYGISFGGGISYKYLNQSPDRVNYDDECDVLSEFNQGKLSVLIATTHMDEGVDINCLDACILAGGGKSNKKILQRIGRALRMTKSGKYAYIIDFTDQGNAVLSYHSNLRLSIYESELGITDNILSGSATDFESEFLRLEGLN